MYQLRKALNTYTSNKARLITFRRTYLAYPEDIYNPAPDQVEELVDWADFYILGEVLTPNIQSRPVTDKIDPSNCIVRAGGTIARTYPQLYMTGKYTQIMKAGSAHDFSIFRRIHPIAPTVNLYDFSMFPPENKEYQAPYRFVFSGTAQKQRPEHSGYFVEAYKMLSEEYSPDTIELVNIQHTSWRDTLEIKSRCHVAFDQHLIGAYANNAIESMYYSQPVFCKVDGWCKCFHPDVPTLDTSSPTAIYKEVVKMIKNPETMFEIGAVGKEYVMRVHSAKNAVTRWTNLIDLVRTDYSGRQQVVKR